MDDKDFIRKVWLSRLENSNKNALLLKITQRFDRQDQEKEACKYIL